MSPLQAPPFAALSKHVLRSSEVVKFSFQLPEPYRGCHVLGRVCTALGNISLVFVILAATWNFPCEVMNEQQIMSVSIRLDI